MNESYLIERNSPIIIYGSATIGIRVCKILRENNFSIGIFIDKRANEINSLLDYQVLNIEDTRLKDFTDNIVIVAVKNVFEHDKIAENLYKIGFRKILYKPYWDILGCSSDDQKSIGMMYDNFIKNRIDFTKEVAFYNPKSSFKLSDFGTIEKKENHRTIFIPTEMIFTNYSSESEWDDIPIGALFPHIEFFKSLEGKNNSDIKSYQEYCEQAALRVGEVKITDAWKENVIHNRIDVFWQMQQSLELDFNFFVRNPITAKYNPKGYFNLTGGKHRATFLVAHNYSYCPVKITEDDYEKWVNSITFSFLEELLKKMTIRELAEILPHPMLYRFPCKRGIEYLKIQQVIVNYVAHYSKKYFDKVNFSRVSICDLVSKYGIFTRIFQKAGSRVVTLKEKNPDQLERLIDLLTNTQEEKKMEDVEKIDIVIADEDTIFQIPESLVFDRLLMIHSSQEVEILNNYIFEKELYFSHLHSGTIFVSAYKKNRSEDNAIREQGNSKYYTRKGE